MLQKQGSGMEDRRVTCIAIIPDLLNSRYLIRETNLDDVMQISNVFTNVSKGEVAKSGDLDKAFGKKDVAEIVKEVGNTLVVNLNRSTNPTYFFQILKKGEVQVGEKERDHDLTSLRKEIATLVAEKCVDPSNQRPYPVGIIEKAMAEAGFSIKQNKNAKSQVNCHPEFINSASSNQHMFRYLNASSSSRLIPNCLSKELECESRCLCQSLTQTCYERKSWKAQKR